MIFVLLGPIALAAAFSVPGHTPNDAAAAAPAVGARQARLPAVMTNDNRHPAGTLAGGVLTLELRAGVGAWRPRGDDGPALQVEAFGERSSPLFVPAPLIRVPEGTEIAARLSNELTSPMRVHGLCERAGGSCAPIDVPAGETRQVRFKSGPAGTYHYWATTTGMPLPFRGAEDTQLSGAFIVDPTGTPTDTDRVFVITEWTSLTREQLHHIASEDDPGASFLRLRPEVLFLINGRVWPHTERLTYDLGERVRWRVVNLSTQVHPMHLHGFYFEVDSLGDGTRDTTFAASQKQRVVTQVMQPGSTMGMTWEPERVGNWLFHCHVMTHVSPTLNVDGSPRSHENHHDRDHLSAGMTGMVIGISVRGLEETPVTRAEAVFPAARALTLVMRSEPRRFGDAPAYGFLLTERRNLDSADRVRAPGPTLVLTRGQPVEITLVNRLPEATAIHWHGMELDSYYDGVHGWSGTGRRVTPLIEPGGTFLVRFTPPRTGTFMYHTHVHDNRQLTSGLYGAMVVVEPDETFDETTDHVFVMGRGGPQAGAPVVVNGQEDPQATWKAGLRHRVRLINITPNDIFSITLQTREAPVDWTPLTKDGAPVAPDRRLPGPARQLIGVGETYDFEYQAPPGRQTLWLEVRSAGGKWQTQAHVIVR